MDVKFWSQIQDGNENAFQELYNSNADILYGYGMKIAHNSDVVSDAIQSLFIYIFEKRRSLTQPNSLIAYLCTSLRHIIVNNLTAPASAAAISLDDINPETYDFDLEIDRQAALVSKEAQDEQIDALQKQLDCLSPQQREMIYLKYYKNLSTQEIAETLGVTERTVYNTIHAAIKKLRDELGFLRLSLLFISLYLLQWLLKK